MDYVIHSFRYPMCGRLSAVGCPSDMIDQIGGWPLGKVDEGYEGVYYFKMLNRYLKNISKIFTDHQDGL